MSDEDRMRVRMYADDRERRSALEQVGSVQEWLSNLGVEIEVASLERSDLARATQLLNKTNQLNLSTRRLSESELMAWVTVPQRRFWTVRVRDRFGELGLVGLVSLEFDGTQARLVDFILSCRAMGRRVEETMLHVAVSWAQKSGAREVVATYRPTPRNGPCLKFFESSGFALAHQHQFVWRGEAPYIRPDTVNLIESDDRRQPTLAAAAKQPHELQPAAARE